MDVVVGLTYFRAASKKKKGKEEIEKVPLSFRAGQLFRSRFFDSFVPTTTTNNGGCRGRAPIIIQSARPRRVRSHLSPFPLHIYTCMLRGDSGGGGKLLEKIPASFPGKRNRATTWAHFFHAENPFRSSNDDVVEQIRRG